MRGPGLPTSDEKEDSFEDQIIIKMCEGDKTKPERRQSVAGRRKTGRADRGDPACSPVCGCAIESWLEFPATASTSLLALQKDSH